MHDTSLPSPPSPAATAATEHLASTMTPTNPAMTAEPERANIDQNIEDMAQEVSLPLEQTLDQSEEFQQLPSQSNVQDQEASEQKCGDSPQKESKSPAEAVLRPEDSIEAIDKFEEEIEKVGDLIPDIKSSAQTPKGSKNDGNPAAAAKKETGTQNPTTTKLRRGPTPIDSKAAAFLKKRATVHPSALDRSPATKGDAKARQVSDSSTGSEKAPIAAKKRVSSVHKAPFVPAKSAKPPTRSNFELPGEAVARKLKEAREERLKHEEEERAKKPTFRARPVRLSQAPVVKATATSKARISMARGENLVPAATKTTSPKPKLTPRLSTLSAAGKRLSTLSVNKRSTPAPANISARFLRGPPSGAVRQSVSTTDAAQLKAKGKEVFNRGQIEHGEREKMKKEKEEAAKKARAEAAERGRLASREWAEKQKAKKVAEKKVKGETGEALVPVA